MSGLGLVLDIGKEALLAQKYAIDIVSHNISNVNTPGYTRQSPVLEAKEAAPLGGVMLGRGVNIEEVIQNSDSFIESRLRDRKTELTAMSEKEVYLAALESIFNENSGRSLSTQLEDFWNAWQDLSNNPSGMPERNILHEKGAFLTETFQELYGDMNEIVEELNNVISKSLEKVNTLLSNIADLNEQIIQIEVNGNANDLRDQRTTALTQLAEYMDIKSYENEDGNLTVTTGRGYVLVSRSDDYPLKYENDEIIWQGSGTNTVTVTDMIAGGKLGGWLDIRDEIIPEYKADLDSFAEAVIWEVNKLHSQGVGLEGFSSITGTNATVATEELGTAESELDYWEPIVDGQFHVRVYETATGTSVDNIIPIDADVGGTTLNSLITLLDGVANLNASDSGGKLSISAAAGYTFAFSSDTSNVLAALGVNTFFTGSSANDIGMNSLLNTNKQFIAAGKVNATTGEIAAGNNENALAMANLQDEDQIEIERHTYERGSAAQSTLEEGTLEAYLHSFIGSIGVDSQSIQRSRQFNEMIVQKLSETRDNISAVSLDEEMTNLIKYQHAYSAAAKLISTAQEMLDVLINTI